MVKEEKGFDRDKLIFGGGFIFGIGGGVTNVGVSPVVGYRFTDRFSAGVGLGYQYLRVKDDIVPVYENGQFSYQKRHDFKLSMYSASVWSRFVVWQNIFIHVEPELNMRNQLEYLVQDGLNFREERKFLAVPSLWVGGGIRQPISDRVSFVGMLLYDVLQDPNSIYGGLTTRFGIVAGF